MILEILAATGFAVLSPFGAAAAYWLRSPETEVPPDIYKALRGWDMEVDPEDEIAENLGFLLHGQALTAAHVARGKELGQVPAASDLAFLALTPDELLEQATPGVELALLIDSEDKEHEEEMKVQHQMAAKDCCLPTFSRGRRRNSLRQKTFLRYWVARVRLQFPLRADRPSDRAAMLNWLGKEMRLLGIRYTHIEGAAMMVVELSLLPSQSYLCAQVAAEEVRSRSRIGRFLYTLQTRISGAVANRTGADEGRV